MAKAIMVQGAGSNVGKSLIVAGLARAFARQGLKVAPFKPQNMSNNAAVTAEGGEIGRAQALQARAAMREPSIHMNPVLLKPESETGSQIIVQGQKVGTMSAREHCKMKHRLMPKVLSSFHQLAADVDLVLIEGAGSPAEINLRAGDIANMGFAEAADIPVILVGDIDRGGVIAQIVGTHAVLPAGDRDRISAFMINKFRGDVELFNSGVDEIANRTDWSPLGVIPWFTDAWRLPAEDILDIASTSRGTTKIAVPRLRRMANFDDLDPLSNEPGVTVEIINPGRALPGDADLVLIPGSKTTIADLEAFRENGWDIDLKAHRRRGGHILGVCGGFQMLGLRISDPQGIEGSPKSVAGLGFLDIETTMTPAKTLALTTAQSLDTGGEVEGYEIHLGETQGPDCANGWLTTEGNSTSAQSADGRVRGTYLHGLFSNDDFRASYLKMLGATASGQSYSDIVENTLDELAEHLTKHLDLDAILALAEPVKIPKSV